MKTLNFYIFRRVFISCVMSLTLFTLVLLSGRVVKDVVVLLSLGYLNWSQFTMTPPRVTPTTSSNMSAADVGAAVASLGAHLSLSGTEEYLAL